MKKLYIKVCNGLVSEVYSDDAEIEIVILDEDSDLIEDLNPISEEQEDVLKTLKQIY